MSYVAQPLVLVRHLIDTGWVRCGQGDRTRLLRDPTNPRFCREQAVYSVNTDDACRNVCAEHLPLAVDLALGRDSEAVTT